MNEDEVKKVIFQLLKKIAPETMPEKMNPDENIREALDIDSFDFLQFIIALSENLSIEIPEQDYGNMATLNNLVNYVNAKIKIK